MVADLSGSAWLVLSGSDGREFHWSVVEEGNGVVIDGQRVSRGAGAAMLLIN